MTPEDSIYAFMAKMVDPAGAATETNPILIWARPNTVRPPKPYYTLRYSVGDQKDHAQALPVDSTGAQQVVDEGVAALELQGFGLGVMAALEDVATRIRLPSSGDAAAALGLAVIDRPRTMDMSALISQAQFEERGLLEVRIRYMNVLTDQVGVIERVEMADSFTGTIENININAVIETLDSRLVRLGPQMSDIDEVVNTDLPQALGAQ